METSYFSASDTGPVVRIENKIDLFVYKDIFINHMLSLADNDPKHNRTYMVARGIKNPTKNITNEEQVI